MPPPPLSLPRYRDLSLRRQSRALGITGKAELFKHERYVGINLCFSRDLVLKASLDGVCVTSVFETQPLLGRDGGRAASVPTSRAAGAPERQGPAVHSGLPRFSWYRCRVSKAMFRTSQGPNELKPHDGSWGPRGPRLWSSIKTKPQDLPPLTPRKRPGPAPDPLRRRPPRCSDPKPLLPHGKRERGGVVFPMDAGSLAQRRTRVFCAEGPTGKVHLPPALPGQQNR